MLPNCNHLARPAPTPPGVYTGRTFSACRPIVGVGDQHDVVQSVSNAISEVTICHKVNSPHSDQVSNVVLNMCVCGVTNEAPYTLTIIHSRRSISFDSACFQQGSCRWVAWGMGKLGWSTYKCRSEVVAWKVQCSGAVSKEGLKGKGAK